MERQMLASGELGQSAWILVGEDGVIFAASGSFSAFRDRYEYIQDFLRVWHRMWYGGRRVWQGYERVIASPQGGRPLRLRATALMVMSSEGGGVPTEQLCGVLVRISNVLPSHDVKAQIGLTFGEERVAEMVLDGKTPAEIASGLGLSINTVRAHMKRIFTKAGVHSRASLVSVLLQAHDRIEQEDQLLRELEVGQ